ncbi:MAG: hypothetical protein AB7V50_07990, partial [Vampirovibrionia bacterium]
MTLQYWGNQNIISYCLNNQKLFAKKSPSFASNNNDDDPHRLQDKSHIVPKGALTLKKKYDDDRLEDKSHIVPKGIIPYKPKKPDLGLPEKESIPDIISAGDIPNSALISKLNYIIKTSYVLPSQSPKDVKRAVVVNDQDFACLNDTSVRYIQGVHPDVSLRTDDFIVTDTKIDPVIPTKTGDLIFPRNSLEFDQVNALVHATETNEMINNYWGIKMPWAFDGPIKLNAHARFYNGATGEYEETWDNAFYSRKCKEILLLIAENKREKGQVVYASRSSDTISHEVSHAKLDGLDVYLADSEYIPSEAVHESFADINALLHALCSDKVVDKILEQTKGDFRKDNLASQFDVQFGKMVLEKEKSCLRNALNSFTRPERLDTLAYCPVGDDDLAIEPHRYSQLLTGTLYDILESIYKNNLKPFDNNQKLSLVKARDTLGRILNRSMLYMPSSEINFKDVALAMLKVDKVEFNGANFSALTKSFLRRNLVTKKEIQDFMLAQNKLPDIKLNSKSVSGCDIEQLVKE